jgi:ubiquinone/menaquinone biosynthesis C-methylase UbiE
LKKPLLRNLLKAGYYKFFPSNTLAHKLFWKYRFAVSKLKIDEAVVFSAQNHPHRLEIISELKKFPGVNSVLELGSSWGVNLLLIRKEFPDMRFLGVDISKEMVDAGNEYFRGKIISNIDLIHRDMTSLEVFKDNEFDLIISDASLIYIDKNSIQHLAEEMCRVARYGLILVEFDDDSQDPFGNVFQSNWVRDYSTVFHQFSGRIDKRRFNEKVWPGKWAQMGKIITVFLK